MWYFLQPAKLIYNKVNMTDGGERFENGQKTKTQHA